MQAGKPALPVKCLPWILAALGALRLQAAESYRLDSGNTRVAFEVQRFGIQWMTARFAEVSGEFALDRQGASSHVDVNVAIASVECNDPRWNDRLRSPEWLDAQRYPYMTYHADRIVLGDGSATAMGELTLHGVTRAVVLDVTFANCEPAATCHFSAHARVKRSDYGLPHGFWMGGDQVDIFITGAGTNHSR